MKWQWLRACHPSSSQTGAHCRAEGPGLVSPVLGVDGALGVILLRSWRVMDAALWSHTRGDVVAEMQNAFLRHPSRGACCSPVVTCDRPCLVTPLEWDSGGEQDVPCSLTGLCVFVAKNPGRADLRWAKVECPRSAGERHRHPPLLWFQLSCSLCPRCSCPSLQLPVRGVRAGSGWLGSPGLARGLRTGECAALATRRRCGPIETSEAGARGGGWQ